METTIFNTGTSNIANTGILNSNNIININIIINPLNKEIMTELIKATKQNVLSYEINSIPDIEKLLQDINENK